MCLWALFSYRLFDRAPVAYAKVVEAISEGVLAVDSRGIAIDITPAAEEILAIPSSEVIGHRMSQVLAHLPALLQLHEKPDLAYVVPVQGEGEADTYCAVRVSPILGWRGRSFGHVLVLRDFTLPKTADPLRGRDLRYQELADSLPETVFEADVIGRITFMNSAGLEQFGRRSEDVDLGLRLTRMLSEGDREHVARDMHRAIVARMNLLPMRSSIHAPKQR